MSLLLALALGAMAPASQLTEDGAVELVAKAVRKIYPNEAPACFSFETEERSPKAFGIAVLEIHKHGCGGDPAIMPVRDRFQVVRSPKSLSRFDATEDTYVPCRLVRGRPICPRD